MGVDTGAGGTGGVSLSKGRMGSRSQPPSSSSVFMGEGRGAALSLVAGFLARLLFLYMSCSLPFAVFLKVFSF